MTKRTEGYPTVYPKGYTVSHVKYPKDGNGEVVYDLNTNGSLCDVYVVDEICCMSIDPLTHLRMFIVNEKAGRIYCERINVGRVDEYWSVVAIKEFRVQIIVWTNEHSYNVWNDINDRLVKDVGIEEEDYGLLPEHLESWLSADLHPGWSYIPENVVRQEFERARNARRAVDCEDRKRKFGTKGTSNAGYAGFVDCFTIVQVRLHNMQCTTKDATDLRQSCNQLIEWLTEEEGKEFVEDNEKGNQFSFFIFWPKNTKRKYTVNKNMYM